MTARKVTIRTDTISTILDGTEFDLEKQNDEDNVISKKSNITTELLSTVVEKFHVLALSQADEGYQENDSLLYQIGRRPSIKVDNWDYIYTEKTPESPHLQQHQQLRCPVHGQNPIQTEHHCLSESFLPDLPLDARKVTTLRRHYYPEGGWGWIVIISSFLVHIINHGVQLSYSQLVSCGAQKFKVDRVHFAADRQSKCKIDVLLR